MKRTFLYLGIMGAVIVLSSGISKTLKSAGPPACYAGEPPSFQNCTAAGCHDDGTANTGSALLELDLGGAESGYNPGTEYTISVRLKKPGLIRAGFELVPIQDNDYRFTPGTITLTDANRTQEAHAMQGCIVADRFYVEHTLNGTAPNYPDSATWQFKWTAPASSVGDITFYVAANEADGDNTEAGDQIYTASKKISLNPNGIASRKPRKYAVFPNPCGQETYISPDYNFTTLRICDLAGKEWFRVNRENLAVKEGKLVIPILVAPKGLLLLNFDGPEGTSTLKIVKMK